MSASEFILVVIVVVLVAVCGGLLSVLRRQAAARTGLEAVPEDVLGLRQEVAALRAEAAGALRHLSVVRYDAFGDMGGHLSWSLALADDGGDGVVLTSIHGRSDARTYAKTISGWSSDQQLSPEEEEALAWGMGLSNSHEMSYRQRMTPDALQARVNTTMRSFNRAVVVVVAPLAGLFADQVGLRPALVVAAVVFALAVSVLATALPLRPTGAAAPG